MTDDIFLRKMRDVYRLCERYRAPRFSKFLDGAQQAVLKKEGLCGGVLFGGYEDAERRILGVFPEWCEPNTSEFPIKAVRVTKKFPKELTHRDYLGTVMSLGLERNMVGDIAVDAEGAYILAVSEAAELIADSLTKVSGCGTRAEICGLDELKVPDKRFEVIDTVAASTRLDAVVSALLKVSRNEAKAVILSGRVSVNHIETQKNDLLLSVGDLLSVRGFGRAELADTGNRTRSDRIHVTFKKYI